MAKTNLSYFLIEVTRYSDTKIKKFWYLRQRQGQNHLEGMAVYDFILSRIYGGEGYYLLIDDDTLFIIADDLRTTVDVVESVIEQCCEVGLFNKVLRDEKGVLTSKGIQERYAVAVKKLKRDRFNALHIEDDYNLIRTDEKEKRTDVSLKRTDEKEKRTDVSQDRIREDNIIKEGTNVPTSVNTDSRQLAIPVDDGESESVKEEKQPPKAAKSRAKESVNWQKLVEYWNEKTAGSFPPITNIENKRRQMAAARIAEYGKEKFIEAIQRAVQSDFLRGQNQRGFTLTFDWLIRPNNFPKVLEGNYDNSTTRTQTTIDNGTGKTKQRNAKFADFGETMEAIRLGINAGLAERDNITGGGQ